VAGLCGGLLSGMHDLIKGTIFIRLRRSPSVLFVIPKSGNENPQTHLFSPVLPSIKYRATSIFLSDHLNLARLDCACQSPAESDFLCISIWHLGFFILSIY
jgi:hypothetical protein